MKLKRRFFNAGAIGLLLLFITRAERTMARTDVLSLPVDVLGRLAKLRSEPKFGPEEASDRFPVGYVGFLPPENRAGAEKRVNALIDTLSANIVQNPTKAYVIGAFEKTYAFFAEADTEDRECLLFYYEDIMDAVGMESSDGALNRMMYGD